MDPETSSLIDAVKAKDVRELERLLSDDTHSIGDWQASLELAVELQDNNDEMLKLLLYSSTYYNVPGILKDALYIAVYSNNINALYILLQHGAGGDGPDCLVLEELLVYAAGAGMVEIVHLLLEVGADLNPTCASHIYGNPLENATDYGHKEVVKFLLDVGADVNAVGGSHGTALSAAAMCGWDDLVMLLIKYGADVNLETDKYLQSALSIAHQGDHSVPGICHILECEDRKRRENLQKSGMRDTLESFPLQNIEPTKSGPQVVDV